MLVITDPPGRRCVPISSSSASGVRTCSSTSAATHHVEVVAERGRQPAVEIGLVEVGQPLAHALVLFDVDTDHLVAERLDARTELAVGAAEVEHPRRRPQLQPAEDAPVRGGGVVLDGVRVLGEGLLAGAEPHLVRPVPQDVLGDVLGVLHAVDVADLVAVVGGDRDLRDPEPCLVQLDDDLGVEVEAVDVVVERQLGEGPARRRRGSPSATR